MIKLKLMICIILSSLVCSVVMAGQIPFGFFRADPAASCGGVSMYGYCYYRNSTANTSCDNTCASRGGCVVGGLDRVGQNGTNAECNSLLTALGLPIGFTVSQASSYGCSGNLSVGDYYRSTNAASCSMSSGSGGARLDIACACAN